MSMAKGLCFIRFPLNHYEIPLYFRCPYGRNDEMECCEANRQYTDDDGTQQECCIGSYVTCAKKLLEGQKSIHWSNNN